jgi:beta-carotene ketolase (CrtW type)
MHMLHSTKSPAKVAPQPLAGRGVLAAGLIIAAWASLLVFLLAFYRPDWHSPAPYLLLLLQTHLYTGLYITGHDAMHGVVSHNKRLNNAIGTVATLLFAYNWFPGQLPKHHRHHHHVGTPDDPDYVTWWQVLLMAATYNVLKIWFPQANVIAFWMIPAVLATLQLFFFGTYLPHRGEHEPDNHHKSRSQRQWPYHAWAFVSCYFFGYHYEHHDQPYLPWWRLWQAKSQIVAD